MTNIQRLHTAIVPVSDQDKALQFYTDKLGFEVRTDTAYGEGARWVEVAPPGAETTVALTRPREGDSMPAPNTARTVISFASDDVDADHARLRDNGVDVDEVMRMGGPVPPMFFFRDPDGNEFIIVEPTD